VRVRADLFDYKMHVRWITDLILGEGGVRLWWLNRRTWGKGRLGLKGLCRATSVLWSIGLAMTTERVLCLSARFPLLGILMLKSSLCAKLVIMLSTR